MGAEALFLAEEVVFGMEVPLEIMENNPVPSYLLVRVMHDSIPGHRCQTREVHVLQCFPVLWLQALAHSHPAPPRSASPVQTGSVPIHFCPAKDFSQIGERAQSEERSSDTGTGAGGLVHIEE